MKHIVERIKNFNRKASGVFNTFLLILVYYVGVGFTRLLTSLLNKQLFPDPYWKDFENSTFKTCKRMY